MILQSKKNNPIVQRCKEVLRGHYGRKFRGLVLYGSLARGTPHRLSDIDLLVLLAPPFNYFKELKNLTELLYPVQLESQRLISAKPANVKQYKKGIVQLYRNAQRDGIMV